MQGSSSTLKWAIILEGGRGREGEEEGRKGGERRGEGEREEGREGERGGKGSGGRERRRRGGKEGGRGGGRGGEGGREGEGGRGVEGEEDWRKCKTNINKCGSDVRVTNSNFQFLLVCLLYDGIQLCNHLYHMRALQDEVSL